MKQDIRKNQELEKAIAHALRLAQRNEQAYSVIECDNKTGYFIEEWYNWQTEAYPTTYLLTVEYNDAEYLSDDDDEDEYSFESKASEIRTNRHKYIKYDVVELNGREYHWDVALNLMDDEIREELHNELAPCTNEEFFETYLIRHFQKYGKEFIIN